MFRARQISPNRVNFATELDWDLSQTQDCNVRRGSIAVWQRIELTLTMAWPPLLDLQFTLGTEIAFKQSTIKATIDQNAKLCAFIEVGGT